MSNIYERKACLWTETEAEAHHFNSPGGRWHPHNSAHVEVLINNLKNDQWVINFFPMEKKKKNGRATKQKCFIKEKS